MKESCLIYVYGTTLRCPLCEKEIASGYSHRCEREVKKPVKKRKEKA